MTNEETLKILAILQANYSNFYKNLTEKDAQTQVNLWSEMFSDEPYELVGVAIKAYIATDTDGYPPSIGKIKEEIRKLTQKDELTEQEAVNIILKAAGNANYYAKEEFDKLSPALKRLVGSPNKLREWAMMDIDELNTVVASNLMRSYKSVSESEQRHQALPSNVKVLFEQIAEKMSIENKPKRYDFEAFEKMAQEKLIKIR